MKIFIETPRLIIREMLPEDEEGMYILDSDPDVHKYLGNKPVSNKETIKKVIEFIRQQYKDNGIGRWSIIDKSNQEFMGWTGFKLNKEERNGYIDYIDIGYRLQKKHWGKGIASECAEACMQYGLDVLKFDKIYASAHVDNIASNKILRKIGLNYKNQFDYDGEMCNWYEYPNL